MREMSSNATGRNRGQRQMNKSNVNENVLKCTGDVNEVTIAAARPSWSQWYRRGNRRTPVCVTVKEVKHR